MKSLFILAYLCVLLTQAPHVWHVYASMETGTIGFEQVTAIGCTIAFEAATGLFTYRLVTGSNKKGVKLGVWFFILASVVANATYYQVLPRVFDLIMPWFAMLALPVALFLFAEEFGREAKSEDRARKREQRALQTAQDAPAKLEQPKQDANKVLRPCKYCDEMLLPSKMGAHVRWAHANGRQGEEAWAEQEPLMSK